MLRNLLAKKNNDEGFTLIELLVVILIIGILAAIALPTFLGQSDKSKDASAKSNARNAVTQMESCVVDETVAACVADQANGDIDQFKDTVVTAGATDNSYVVTATSSSGNGTYIITKSDPGFVYTVSGTVSGGEAWAANSTVAAPAT